VFLHFKRRGALRESCCKIDLELSFFSAQKQKIALHVYTSLQSSSYSAKYMVSLFPFPLLASLKWLVCVFAVCKNRDLVFDKINDHSGTGNMEIL